MVKVLNNTNIVGQSTSLVFKTNINDPIGKWTITIKESLELYDGITLKVMVTTIPDLNRNTLQFKYGLDMTPETTVYKSPSVPITSEHIDKYAILNLTYTTIDGNRGWYADAEPKIEFPTQPNDFGKVGVKNGSIVKYIEATEEHDTIGLVAGDNITLDVNEETRDITIISTAVTEVGNLNTLSTESLTPSSGENFSNNIDLHKISKTGNYNDLNNKPTIPTVPTEISAFNNDVGYITLNDVPRQVNADWNADSGVSEILNKPTIHTYTAGEGIEITQNDVISCTVEQDTDHAHLEHLDYESSGHTGFQPTLSSQNAGTDISITVVNGIPKINNTQVPVQPSWGNITGTLSNQTDLQDALNNKQNELIPGTGVNIENDIISVTPPVWGNITGTLANQTDLQDALNTKQDVLSSANEGDDISITLVNGVPKINVINIQDDISTINGNISDIVSDISDINSDISDLQSDVGTIQSYIPSNASSSNQLAVHSDITTIQGNITSIDGRVTTIEGKIPTQASTTNQLADKDFVNSSIATSTATFRETYNVVTDLHLSTSATHQQVATALGNTISVADNNDYCFVEIPTDDLTPTETLQVDRYKYNGTSWSFEYTLNNSGYTSAQWKAINSGITSGKVTQYDDYATSKQDTIVAGTNITIGADGKTISSDIPNATQQVYGKVLLGTAGGAATFESVGDGKPICYPTTASDVKSTSMLVKSSVSDNGKILTENGFVYNTSGNPTISDTKVICDLGAGFFEKKLENLTQNTEYHIKSYGQNSSGLVYGSELVQRTHIGPIPVEYQLVEYLKSTGTQYLIVSTTIDLSYNVKITFTPTLLNLNTKGIFGSRIGAPGTLTHQFFVTGATNQTRYDYGRSQIFAYAYGLTEYKIITDTTLGVIYINGSTYVISTCIDIFNSPMLLFTTVMNGSVLDGLPMKVKYFEYGDKKLYPVYRIADNKPGMYDIVNGVFYTNQGTGEFIVGPDKEWDE